MSRSHRLGLWTLGLSVTLTLASARGDEEPRPGGDPSGDSTPIDVAIVQPGAPGSPEAAKGFLGALAAWLAPATGVEKVEATYDNEPAEAWKRLRDRGARVGVVSLGFYLEHRCEMGLLPVLEAAPAEQVRVLVLKGSGLSPAELAGKTVSGGPIYEPRFLDRIVFPREEIDPEGRGVLGWKAAPTTRTSTALYRLDRGKVDAVIVGGREYRSLEELGRLKNLEKLLESKYYPPALVVVFGRVRGDERLPLTEEQQRLVAAFERMTKDPAAQDIVRTMGCEEFKRIQADRLEGLEKRYGHGREEK